MPDMEITLTGDHEARDVLRGIYDIFEGLVDDFSAYYEQRRYSDADFGLPVKEASYRDMLSQLIEAIKSRLSFN